MDFGSVYVRNGATVELVYTDAISVSEAHYTCFIPTYCTSIHQFRKLFEKEQISKVCSF